MKIFLVNKIDWATIGQNNTKTRSACEEYLDSILTGSSSPRVEKAKVTDKQDIVGEKMSCYTISISYYKVSKRSSY